MIDNKESPLSTDNKVVKLHKDVTARFHDINESIETAKQMRVDLCEDITQIFMEQYMAMCSSYGIFNDPNRFDHRDLIMVENAIMGSLYRHYGLEHPIHEVVEEVFEFEGVEDSEEN